MAIWFGGMGILYALLLRSLSGPLSVPGSVRVGVSALWIFAVWFLAQRALLHWRTPRAKSFVLTTVSIRTATVGMLLTEFLSACLVLAPLTVLLVGIVGYGFLSPGSLLLVPLAVGLFTASAVVTGYVAGFTYMIVSARSRWQRTQHGQLIVHAVSLIVVGYVVVVLSTDVPVIWEVVSLEWLPTSWFIDIAVFGTPVTSASIRVLAGVSGCLLVVGGGGLLVERLAREYWVARPISTADGTNNTAREKQKHGDGTLAAAVSPVIIPRFVGRPSQCVAQMVVLRLRRAPRRLLLLATTSLSLGIYLSVLSVQSNAPMSVAPVVCVLFVPWFVGAVFGLNPLGDEGNVLPATLTSSISGRQFVRGLLVPGLLYGLPLTILSTLIGGVVSPYSIGVQAWLVVIGAVLTVVAVCLAPAVGMLFPRFSAMTIGQSSDVVPPSMTALVLYSLGIWVLGGALVFALLAPANGSQISIASGVSTEVLRTGGVTGGLGIGLVIARLSYSTAVKRFRQYTVS
ncbi:hypothetical protein [Halostagnicola sp. A56]|uniref:hypothetical protein n=1 Tax=Halostagnicola sp. A56 TaxID=1495067 RepID=UPI000679B278|nr:hypothetical protein [Halostagnicola sp. A56]